MTLLNRQMGGSLHRPATRTSATNIAQQPISGQIYCRMLRRPCCLNNHAVCTCMYRLGWCPPTKRCQREYLKPHSEPSLRDGLRYAPEARESLELRSYVRVNHPPRLQSESPAVSASRMSVRRAQTSIQCKCVPACCCI